MSNRKHGECELRSIAQQAKKRLTTNDYADCSGPYAPPKNITPAQREIYIKIAEMAKNGEDVLNPIKQFADEDKMATLSHAERQRYILSVAADYATMKRVFDERVNKSDIS